MTAHDSGTPAYQRLWHWEGMFPQVSSPLCSSLSLCLQNGPPRLKGGYRFRHHDALTTDLCTVQSYLPGSTTDINFFHLVYKSAGSTFFCLGAFLCLSCFKRNVAWSLVGTSFLVQLVIWFRGRRCCTAGALCRALTSSAANDLAIARPTAFAHSRYLVLSLLITWIVWYYQSYKHGGLACAKNQHVRLSAEGKWNSKMSTKTLKSGCYVNNNDVNEFHILLALDYNVNIFGLEIKFAF